MGKNISSAQFLEMQQRIDRSRFIELPPKVAKPPTRKGRKPHSEVQNEILKDKTTLIFEWAGEHISLNEYYSSKHWSVRNKQAKYWHEKFKKMLPKNAEKIKQYVLTLEYNSRLDVSNTILLPKFIEDMLQEEGIIINDTKDFCKGIHLIPKIEMAKFSYKITVTPI